MIKQRMSGKMIFEFLVWAVMEALKAELVRLCGSANVVTDKKILNDEYRFASACSCDEKNPLWVVSSSCVPRVI